MTLMRGRSPADRSAHNRQAEGSTPSPATTHGVKVSGHIVSGLIIEAKSAMHLGDFTQRMVLTPAQSKDLLLQMKAAARQR